MVEFRRNNRFKGNGGAFNGPRPNRNNDRRDSSCESRGEILVRTAIMTAVTLAVSRAVNA